MKSYSLLIMAVLVGLVASNCGKDEYYQSDDCMEHCTFKISADDRYVFVSSCVVITHQETFKSILTESELLELDDPAIFTKYVVKTSGAVVATGLSAACIFFFLTPPGVVACSGAAILGVSTAIVAPDYVDPDERISKCSPEEYGARLKWLKDRKPHDEDCSKLLKSVDKYCAQQCIYPTMVSPVGGDRCYGGQVKSRQETFKSILTESELLELDDPATFTKNVVKTSGAVAATGLSAACVFFFLTPPGIVACAGAAVLGFGTAIVAPDYVAPDVRISKCSPEEYGSRLKWLKDRNPQNEDCSRLLESIDKHCAKQCNYPTRVSPVGGDRCYDGQVKRLCLGFPQRLSVVRHGNCDLLQLLRYVPQLILDYSGHEGDSENGYFVTGDLNIGTP
ncbi:hypothetical protein ACI65C_012532 [Semiaphis heraclei]